MLYWCYEAWVWKVGDFDSWLGRLSMNVCHQCWVKCLNIEWSWGCDFSDSVYCCLGLLAAYESATMYNIPTMRAGALFGKRGLTEIFGVASVEDSGREFKTFRGLKSDVLEPKEWADKQGRSIHLFLGNNSLTSISCRRNLDGSYSGTFALKNGGRWHDVHNLLYCTRISQW